MKTWHAHRTSGHRYVVRAVCLALSIPAASAPAQPGHEYRLDVGDVLSISVLGQPELSGSFEVSESGKIVLPLVGAVSASGAGVSELQHRITARFGSGFLKDPKLSVAIQQRRPFYILGGVNRPGQYPHVPGLTVLRAVAIAGGYPSAAPQQRQADISLSRIRDDFALLSGEYWASLLREARLLAEQQGATEIEQPQVIERIDDRAGLAAMLDGERRILKLHRTALQRNKAALQQLVDSHREEVTVLQSQMEAVERQTQLVREQTQEFERMAARGLVPKANLLEFRRSDADLEVKRLELMARILRAKQGISEGEQKLFNIDSEFQRDTEEALLEVRSRLATLRERLLIARSALEQAAVVVADSGGPAAAIRTEIKIIRHTADGVRSLAAEEASQVLPGDVVRVSALVTDPLSGDEATDSESE